jgi:hypothetical protein
MGSPGNWTVTCAPGYRYEFTFDDNGKLTGTYRLP